MPLVDGGRRGDSGGISTVGLVDTMAIGSPASRGYFRIRFSPFDTAWAIASPMTALAIRDAYILSYEGFLYCSMCTALSLVAFSAFPLHARLSTFFTFHAPWA